LNRYGRMLLTKEEILASNMVGGLLLLSAVFLIIAALTMKEQAVIAAAGCIMMTIPVAGSFSIEKPGPRKAMFIYTGVMGAILIVAIATSLTGSPLGVTPIVLFVIGFLLFGWIANGIKLRN